MTSILPCVKTSSLNRLAYALRSAAIGPPLSVAACVAVIRRGSDNVTGSRLEGAVERVRAATSEHHALCPSPAIPPHVVPPNAG
jgi:hypothetical protein